MLLIVMGLAVRASGLPLKLFDRSSGFRLPDGSVLSPDASLLRQERREALTPEERRGFAPQDGHLPAQRCPAGLAADSRTTGGLDAGSLFPGLQIDLLEI
jgi:hypothetical protein